jgi:hypothetical protein
MGGCLLLLRGVVGFGWVAVWVRVEEGRYSVYLLCWYKSTNADAEEVRLPKKKKDFPPDTSSLGSSSSEERLKIQARLLY